MGNGVVSKAARKAARVAASAAAEELARRTRANMEDLATFFSAREREEAVEGWLAEKLGGLREQAGARRGEQRRQCGAALGAMRDRGESVREIARMAGVSENTVRELIRAAKQAPMPAVVAGEPEPEPVRAPEPALSAGPGQRSAAGVGGVPEDGERQG